MFWKLITFAIVTAIIIIALTELSNRFGPLGFDSSYSFKWLRDNAEGFITPSLESGSYGAAQQENTQVYFEF